ncbi:hypothetical protein K457DRAFT_349626 [Linnemannia elongata AG-77]|uniref:Uncharacterized protein n=1 Tax=Linnemannia elongata AG-77 TaxID=1314771 RepID=A0A197K4S9_9FUNG|nr:hypothetical protein K457DRAFT_349626 [Linnemannia elongata AG-77]
MADQAHKELRGLTPFLYPFTLVHSCPFHPLRSAPPVIRSRPMAGAVSIQYNNNKKNGKGAVRSKKAKKRQQQQRSASRQEHRAGLTVVSVYHRHFFFLLDLSFFLSFSCFFFSCSTIFVPDCPLHPCLASPLSPSTLANPFSPSFSLPNCLLGTLAPTLYSFFLPA